MSEPTKTQRYLLAHVAKHPVDIINVTAKKFGVSVQAVHKQLKPLLLSGAIKKTGKTRQARYSLGVGLKSPPRFFSYVLTPSLEEHVVWENELAPLFRLLPDNVRQICEYGATEMINNAKDHSEGSKLAIAVEVSDQVVIWLDDDGVGIFAKVAKALGLAEEREAVLHLTKGKFTTDPKRHSGEGLFFTSRVFDQFTIISGELTFLRTNEEDWALRRDEPRPGTGLVMKISPTSARTVQEVFDRYATDEDRSFSKTRIIVELGRNPNESYLSRSQAKRIMLGLEKFKEVVLDFAKVKTVGQGFVDEVFRVYQSSHPNIKITHVNANEDVLFMIERT